MLVRRFLPLVAVSCLMVTTLGAEIKRERREATFGALVGGIASPFINFKQGFLNLLGGSNAQKKPAKQVPKPSYGAPAPSYNAPAPSYGAPAPSYNAPAPAYNAPAPSYNAPAPSYNAPAPSYNAPAPSYNAPAPSYNAPAPSYDAPAPSYNAPAQLYNAPAQSYNAPAPSYSAPAPAYDPPAPKPEIQILPAPDLSQYAPVAAPAVDTYGSPAAAPAIDTYGSPAAAPAVDTYGSPAAAPAVDTYGSPAAAPAVDTYGSPAAAPAVDTYGSPAAAPAVAIYSSPAVAPAVYTYDPPAAAPSADTYGSPAVSQAVDSYGSPVLPNYVVEQVAPEAPALPPVYEPATYDPAPVEYVPTAAEVADVVVPRENVNLADYTVDLTENSETVADTVDVKVAGLVDLKVAEEPAVDVTAPEARAPKAFSGEQPSTNQLQTVDEKPADEIIVIDLTDSFVDTSITTENIQASENTNEDLVIQEVETEEPIASQIITFEAVDEIPAISGPIRSSNEVISFTPQQDSQVRNIDFTAVQSDLRIDTFTVAPAVVNLVEVSTESETTIQEALPTETVTPIVPNQELKSVVVELDSAPLEIADIEAVDFNDVEVIDLRTDKKSSGLTIIDHDEDHPEVIVVVDETTTQAQDAFDLEEEELAIDVPESELILESDTDFNLVNEEETAQVVEKILPTQEPELRRVTFEILSDEEAKKINPEVTFRIVDAASEEENTFDTFRVLETTTDSVDEEASPSNTPVVNIGELPLAIGSDPVFQEIVKTSEDSENVKRGYNAYDPRHSQVYAHKYNDKYSNWYYFRKGY